MKKKSGAQFTFNVIEMLYLYRQGWKIAELARKYKKDHTTISFHCTKWKTGMPEPFDIYPSDRKNENNREPENKKVVKYAHLFDEPLNKGKTYKQYLALAKTQDKIYGVWENVHKMDGRAYNEGVNLHKKRKHGKFVPEVEENYE